MSEDKTIDKPLLKGLPRKQQKIVDAVCSQDQDEKQKITFSHSTMCQTSLPFKNMGEQRKWVSKNGLSVVQLEAGSVLHPEKDEFIELGLPYGTKPRLMLMHLNQQAILTGKAEIEVENTLGAFIKRIGIDSAPNGRVYGRVKDQLARLAASRLLIGNRNSNGSVTTEKRDIVKDLNVFFTKEEN